MTKLFSNISEVKNANKSNGYHFFDRDTMRFFNSKIETSLYAGKYFITSEQCDWGEHPRLYTIRQALENGSIKEVSQFQEFKSLNSARSALRVIILKNRSDSV